MLPERFWSLATAARVDRGSEDVPGERGRTSWDPQQGSADRGVRIAFGTLTASAQVPWGPSPLTSVLRTGNSSRLWYDFPCCRAGEVSGSQFRPRHTATRRPLYCAENHDAASPADQTRNRCSDMPRQSCGGTSVPERPRAPHETWPCALLIHPAAPRPLIKPIVTL